MAKSYLGKNGRRAVGRVSNSKELGIRTLDPPEASPATCRLRRLCRGITNTERDRLGLDRDDDHRLTSPAYDQGIGFLVVLPLHRARSSSRMRPPHLGYHVCILVLPRSAPRLSSRPVHANCSRIGHPRKVLRGEVLICSPAENLIFGVGRLGSPPITRA